MRRRWVWVSILAATLMLGILGTGAAVLAQSDGGSTEESTKQSLASRLAAILGLGLDEATVQSALDQAKREIGDERLEKKLSRLVEKGVLTEAQKQEYLDWYNSRPEGPLAGANFLGPRKHGKFMGKFGFGRGHGGQFRHKSMPAPLSP